jgi:hypothetical protein
MILERQITRAVSLLYLAQEQYKAAKLRSEEEAAQYSIPLVQAREAERDVLRKLQDHANAHGCKA